jgi:hypothetical protein
MARAAGDDRRHRLRADRRVLAGSYDLRATLGGEVSDTLLGLAPAPSARETVKLRLQPGRFVEVVVTDGDDELAEVVPNADVVVVEDGLGPFPERGRTGTDGKVRLGPCAWPATVSARADGFVARSGFRYRGAGEAVRVALVRAARLEGREVVDAHGRPIEGASIEVVGTASGACPWPTARRPVLPEPALRLVARRPRPAGPGGGARRHAGAGSADPAGG